MKDDLRITLIQTNLCWEDREANLEMFSEKIASLQDPTDLIVLPEMFTTGFSMQPEKFSETMDSSAMGWMKETAKEKNAVICGSIMMRDNGRFYNRLIWMRPDGSFEFYDKRHLFGLGEEHNHYSPGKEKKLVQLKGWQILPLICYDLRFPVWCRNGPSGSAGKNTSSQAYDILLFVANWPDRRIHAWKRLLEARAIENQCYVIGVNRIGDDGKGIHYSGESSVIDPRGEIFWCKADHECIHPCTLSYHHLNHTRETLPFLRDGDDFEIKV